MLASALLLTDSPAMAWSYGYYGGHHYGHHGSYYGRHYGYNYGNYYNHYPGYRYRSYGNYRNNNYSTRDYTDSNDNEYGSDSVASNNVTADREYGWKLLADGEQHSALNVFSTQARNDPDNGTYKIGYALAAAETGDLDKGVRAMRRATRIDPDALHYLTLDSGMQNVVSNLIHNYENDSSHGLEATDRDFMVASLYYLLHDAEAADRVLPRQDAHTSVENLDRLIRQMQANE
jgi:hypothetical protein